MYAPTITIPNNPYFLIMVFHIKDKIYVYNNMYIRMVYSTY